METMKGVVVTGKGQYCIKDDIPRPVCGDYEALVHVKYCGFCNGTDLHIIDGTMTHESGLGEYPTILGHEGSGVVVEMGKKVRNIKLGDKYVHPSLFPEVGGGYTRTYGGMADYGLVADYEAMLEDGIKPEDMPFMNMQYPPYPKYYHIPDDFDLEEAAALLSMSECQSAAKNFGAGPGKNILIYGAGPMGIGVALFCKAYGADKVTITDLQESRLKLAKDIAKVDRTIDTSKVKIADAIGSELFDIVIDIVGFTSILLEGSQFVKPFGRVGSMGVLRSDDLKMNVQALKNNTMLQMLNLPYREYAVMGETIEMIKDGRISAKSFYSHVVDRENIAEAVELVRTKKALKVIIKIND